MVEGQCQEIADLINADSETQYRFNEKTGELERDPTARDNPNGSSYYSERLDAGIASESTISIVIADQTADKNGVIRDVDSWGGGGHTLGRRLGGSQIVTISGRGNSHAKDIWGQPLWSSPADILMHELVGHAIPHITQWDTKSAIGNENKVRGQMNPITQRQDEPGHGL